MKLHLVGATLIAAAFAVAACSDDPTTTDAADGTGTEVPTTSVPVDDETETSETETSETQTSQTDTSEAETSQTDTSEEGAEQTENLQRLWIGPELLDCEGVAPQTCMQIAESADGEYEYFYDQIKGFSFEEGTSYVIDVSIEEVVDPPEDASSLRYTLVEIIEEVEADS